MNSLNIGFVFGFVRACFLFMEEMIKISVPVNHLFKLLDAGQASAFVHAFIIEISSVYCTIDK